MLTLYSASLFSILTLNFCLHTQNFYSHKTIRETCNTKCKNIFCLFSNTGVCFLKILFKRRKLRPIYLIIYIEKLKKLVLKMTLSLFDTSYWNVKIFHQSRTFLPPPPSTASMQLFNVFTLQKDTQKLLKQNYFNEFRPP